MWFVLKSVLVIFWKQLSSGRPDGSPGRKRGRTAISQDLLFEIAFLWMEIWPVHRWKIAEILWDLGITQRTAGVELRKLWWQLLGSVQGMQEKL